MNGGLWIYLPVGTEWRLAAGDSGGLLMNDNGYGYCGGVDMHAFYIDIWQYFLVVCSMGTGTYGEQYPRVVYTGHGQPHVRKCLSHVAEGMHSLVSKPFRNN